MAVLRVFFAFLATLTLGCAPTLREVDKVKSCDAFFYESDSIDFQLTQSRPAAERAKDEYVPLHIFAAGIGAMASVAPILVPSLAISGGSVYIMPSITVAYYNRFVAPKEAIDRNDYL
ncbi:MAG: hypothetical protein LBQ52_05605, partial [Helicobacteraceae bacterium]|nr:hypothetical protein [Helicobacteraceae bacterium]